MRHVPEPRVLTANVLKMRLFPKTTRGLQNHVSEATQGDVVNLEANLEANLATEDLDTAYSM